MKLTDVMGCAGAAILFLLAFIWIPFIGPLLSLLTPLPFLYYSSKLGRYDGFKVIAATILILGLITRLAGYPQIILFCIEFCLLGLLISEIYRRKLTFGLTIFWGTVLAVSVGVSFLFFVSLSREMGPLDLILDYIHHNFNEVINAYERMGLDNEKVADLRRYGQFMADIISRIYPSLAIIGSGFIVWINVVISKPLFRKGNIEYPDFEPLDRWQAPEYMVWGFIVSGFALFFSVESIKLLSINTFIIMLVIYVFHGLSIVLFFFNKYHIPLFLRFGVYLLLIFQQFFLIGLAIAGLFDQWVDFRKIFKTKAA